MIGSGNLVQLCFTNSLRCALCRSRRCGEYGTICFKQPKSRSYSDIRCELNANIELKILVPNLRHARIEFLAEIFGPDQLSTSTPSHSLPASCRITRNNPKMCCRQPHTLTLTSCMRFLFLYTVAPLQVGKVTLLCNNFSIS